MDNHTKSPRGPDPSYFRLDENAKQANLNWISRIADQGKKRKADTALPEIENPPADKHHKLSGKESPEVIIIEDDSQSAHSQRAANLADRRKGSREERIGRFKDEERMKDFRSIVENLRDQVADWTLRVQQSETSLEILRAKIGDPPGLAWQEEMRGITVKELGSLIKRIEKLEDSRIGDNNSQSQISSTHDPPKSTFKNPTIRPDKVSTQQSTTDKKLKISSSATHENQGHDEVYTMKSANIGGVQLDVLSDIGISSAESFWKAPVLSNKGLKTLLQKVDFRNIEHLRALNTLDDRSIPRDCIMFCDSQTFGIYQVDYILRTGTTTTYVQDPGATMRDREMKLYKRGLSGLRIYRFEVCHSPENPDDRRLFKEWKRGNTPPKYVYDIGQLFLRRHGRDRHELFETKFNLVMDITKPQKSVWLVMRPQYPTSLSLKRERESNTPFPSPTGGLLNGAGIAKLADTIGELDFDQGPFAKKSQPMYSKAEKLVASTRFMGLLTFQFPTPDIDHMQAKVVAGWKESVQ